VSGVAESNQGSALQQFIEPLACVALVPHAHKAGVSAFFIAHELYFSELVSDERFKFGLHLLPFGLVVVADAQAASGPADAYLVFEAEHFQVVLPLIEFSCVPEAVLLRGENYLHCVDVFHHLLLHAALHRAHQECLQLVDSPRSYVSQGKAELLR